MVKENNIQEKVIDASGRTLGRVASEAAINLSGKTKVTFKRNVYSGSKVRIINSSKIKITAKKLDSIYHTRYSGFRGGLRVLKGTETAEKKGMKELVRLSIYQMLPANKLRREMLKRLKIED